MLGFSYTHGPPIPRWIQTQTDNVRQLGFKFGIRTGRWTFGNGLGFVVVHAIKSGPPPNQH
jgi:hypothetical protein